MTENKENSFPSPGLQEEFHNTKPGSDKATPLSIFLPGHQRTEWCSPSFEILQTIATGSPEIINYHLADVKNSFLTSMNMYLTLPKIKLNKSYKTRICYTPNTLINYIDYINFNISGLSFSFDSKSLDIWRQVYATDKRTFDEGIGNIAILQQWNSELPSRRLWLNIPWSFTFPRGRGFPLLLLDNTKINIQAKFHNKISHILRMQEYKESMWYDIEVDKKYFDVITMELPAPMIQIRRDTIAEFDANYWDPSNDCDGSPKRIDYYLYDFIKPNDTNKDNLYVKFKASTIPVYGVHILANYNSCIKSRNYSNYTSNPEDLNEGYHPLSDISIVSKALNIKQSFEFFTSISYSEHGMIAPDESGYYSFFPTRCDPLSNFIDNAINMEAGLRISANVNKEYGVEEDKIKLYARCLVKRKVAFVKDTDKKKWYMFVDIPQNDEVIKKTK